MGRPKVTKILAVNTISLRSLRVFAASCSIAQYQFAAVKTSSPNLLPETVDAKAFSAAERTAKSPVRNKSGQAGGIRDAYPKGDWRCARFSTGLKLQNSGQWGEIITLPVRRFSLIDAVGASAHELLVPQNRLALFKEGIFICGNHLVHVAKSQQN